MSMMSFTHPSAGHLSNDQLHRFAPSIFATTPYHGMSERYRFVPTIQVIEALRKEGILPVKAFECRTRIEDKRGFAKHLVRLRHADVKPMVGGVFPEIVLVNSHDGASAYQMHAGVFRLVCSNGMIVADSTFEKLSLRHSGRVCEEAIAAACRIGQEVPRIGDQIERFYTVELTPNERGVFAAAALDLKYPKDEESGHSKAPITVEQLLRPRRHDDQRPDLFTTFNVVQEHLLQGGLRGLSRGEARRPVRTRPAQSVNEDVRLNKALWALTERMAELKGA